MRAVPENPLNNWPEARKVLYLIQWVYNGAAAFLGAYFAVEGTPVDELPKWYVLALGIAPVVWAYLGFTAQNNVPSVRDVAAGAADPADVERVIEDERGYLTWVIGLLVALILLVVLLRLV